MISEKHSWRRIRPLLPLVVLVVGAAPAFAVSVQGTIRDTLGNPISGALVVLVDNGKLVVSDRSRLDGSYRLSTATAGRFYVIAGGHRYRQLTTESFYGSALASMQQDITLETDTVRDATTSTSSGVAIPQAQQSASVTGLSRTDFQNMQNVADALRTVPGFNVVQSGGRGGPASLYVRGGDADANKILLDGVPMEDIGGGINLADIAATGIASAEAYRGPASVIYGADANSGVVAFKTPEGSTPFPSLFYEGDGGNFGTYRNEIQAGGTRNKLDYYSGFSAFQTANSLDQNSFHDVTSSANVGYAVPSVTHLRGVVRNSDAAVGSPGQYQFTQTAQSAKQGNQDLFVAATLDRKFSDRWQVAVTYGAARKQGSFQRFGPVGDFDASTGNYLGQSVQVTGANGYSAVGRAVTSLAGASAFTNNDASNRDSAYGQSTYQFTPHVYGVLGFRWENERGQALGSHLSRTNYDSTFAMQGNVKNRFFYTLGGGAENNGLFGTVGEPHLGAAYYLVTPGSGLLHGTKVNFNFSRGYREPSLPEQIGSLQGFLVQNGAAATANRDGIKPIDAEMNRSYDSGFEQTLLNEKATLRVTYFHNQFTNGIESISPGVATQLLPQLSPQQQSSLAAYLDANQLTGIDTNSLAYRAQGVETEIDYSPKANIFVRGGWTWLDTRVQHSLTADALGPSFNSSSNFANIPIGNISPLIGARVFQRPPHTGFVSVTWSGKKWSGVASSVFSSRSDDSTRLGGLDAQGGNSLLLPNRNLDSAYTSMHAGGTYQWKERFGFYTQLDNLLSQQHISPIGTLSTPMTLRGGVRITLGRKVE